MRGEGERGGRKGRGKVRKKKEGLRNGWFMVNEDGEKKTRTGEREEYEIWKSLQHKKW